MRTLLVPCCAAALAWFGSTAAVAQDKTAPSKQSKEVQTDTKTTNGNNSTIKESTDTINGKVESYAPGKTLKVTVPGKTESTRSFDLSSKDWTYHVARNLKRGQWVTVSEKTDNNGHKTLTVGRSSKGQASRTANGTS